MNKDNQRVMDILKKMDICLMATFNENGEIHTRPMAIQVRQDSDEPCAYFYIRKSSQVGQEIKLKDYIHLGYMDQASHLYVTFKGKGSICQDDNLKNQLWTPVMKTWFPEGLEDPQLELIKVDMKEAQIWDSVSSRVLNFDQITSGQPTASSEKGRSPDQSRV